MPRSPSQPSIADDPASASAEITMVHAHQRSLRSKLVLSLAAMFLIFLAINEIVRSYVIAPQFSTLEQAAAQRDAERVLAAIDTEAQHLGQLAEQWALRWQSSPDRNSMDWSTLDVRWAAAVSTDRGWQWLYYQDGAIDRDAMPESAWHHLARHCCPTTPTKSHGITGCDETSMAIFAAVPAGDTHLVVGRAVDPSMLAAIEKRTHVDFTIQTIAGGAAGQRSITSGRDAPTLLMRVPIQGIKNERLAHLYVEVSREITTRSTHTFAVARSTFILGSVGALLLWLLLLQRLVIGPLNALREHSDTVAENGLDIAPLNLDGNDEVGALAKAYDHMVRRLREAQSELSKASQAAGRSQVAATVIHNVGNVLTNVNSLLDAASDRMHGLRIDPLDKLASRLNEPDTRHELLDATPAYLEGLAVSLKSDRDAVSQLLLTLHDNVRHIHDVIRDQQRHADHSLQAIPVNLSRLVDEAIGCCRARLDHDRVAVDVSCRSGLELITDRSLLLQIMINIIGNAHNALADSPQHPRRLTIHIETIADSVRIDFRDNGCGMTAATLARVFEAHFTTRQTGSGLGLHFCALTLKRLHGSIRAASDGPGCGSVFSISLPVTPLPSTELTRTAADDQCLTDLNV